MLLTVIILWPLSLIAAFLYGMYKEGIQDKPKVNIVHTIPDEIQKFKVIHLDEWDGSIETITYERSNRWTSGFKKVIIKE